MPVNDSQGEKIEEATGPQQRDHEDKSLYQTFSNLSRNLRGK